MIEDQVIKDGFSDIDGFLIHTGSKKIIDGIIKDLNIIPYVDKTSVSFDILTQFANLSSGSIGFMLNQVVNGEYKGRFLMISFGVGFSGSIAIIDL